MPLLLAASGVAVVATTQYPFFVKLADTLYSRLNLQWVLFRHRLCGGSSSTSSSSSSRSSSSNDEDKARQGQKITVSGLFTYPVKSFRAVRCAQVTLGDRGFEYDRRYMVVTAPAKSSGKDSHTFLTQRQCPSMATVNARLLTNPTTKEGTLTLSSDRLLPTDAVEISALPSSNAKRIRARVWDDEVEAYDMGDEAATFLEKLVRQDKDVPDEMKSCSVRLIMQMDDCDRSPDDNLVPSMARSWWSFLGFSKQTPRVALGDGFPISIATEASLEELNRRLQAKNQPPIPMSRFRPNIVVSGTSKPFEEDNWKLIRIGDGAIFHVVAACSRCKEACTDQRTGAVSAEPVATLSEFRTPAESKASGNVYFAQNALADPSSIGSTIYLGDSIEVIQVGEPVWGR